MKKLLLLLMFLLVSISIYSQKQKNGAHIGAGFVVGGSVNFIPCLNIHKRPDEAIWIGGVAGLMAGLAKEHYDKAMGAEKDLHDVFNTVVGGFLGGVVAYEIHKGVNRRKLRRERLVRL